MALAVFLSGVQSQAAEIQAGALKFTLDSKTGNLVALSAGMTPVPLRVPGAVFHVWDVKARSGFVQLTGPVTQKGGESVMLASAPSLGLTAHISFQTSGGMLAWRADIADARRQERGLVVSMTLPLQPSGLVWSGDLYASESAEPGKLYGNNVTPISAVRSQRSNWAIAAAIPPSAPVMYDTHLKDGDFGLYYYVGLSSAPRDMPNRTWVAGLLYDVDSNWGFRSALQKYYEAFPDFYARSVPRTGAWCHFDASTEQYAATCGFYEIGGGEWKKVEAVPRMGTNIARSPQQWVELNEIDKAHRLGVPLFPYTIVGQRQIFMLPGEELYTDYDRAMTTFEKWTTDVEMPYQNPANANSFNSVAELKEIIRNSGLHQQDGRFVTDPRMYTGNTLTFPLNPNPRLFFDNPKKTIAKYTLEDYIPKLLKAAPEIDGFYVDSMGLWNDFTNYRRDHFAYAKYPLAVDQDGDPVLRNLSSHYEYLEEFRKRMHSMKKWVFINGVNGGGGTRDGETDHAASRSTSRFFLAALGDFAGIESGWKTTAERMGHYRIMSGKKPYAIMDWGTKAGGNDQFLVYFKRATAFGIFPSVGSRLYTVTALKPLPEYYLPLIRKLNDAGWEPVTGVTGTVPGVLCERFGRQPSGPMYITLFNDGPAPANLVLRLEESVFGSKPSVAPIDNEGPTMIPIRNGSLTLRLAPAELRIFQTR